MSGCARSAGVRAEPGVRSKKGARFTWLTRMNILPTCHCEERSRFGRLKAQSQSRGDEAIQLDCRGRQASLAMTNKGVHQQQSEESTHCPSSKPWILRSAQNDKKER